jgi:hypothetical protein
MKFSNMSGRESSNRNGLRLISYCRTSPRSRVCCLFHDIPRLCQMQAKSTHCSPSGFSEVCLNEPASTPSVPQTNNDVKCHCCPCFDSWDRKTCWAPRLAALGLRGKPQARLLRPFEVALVQCEQLPRAPSSRAPASSTCHAHVVP